MKIPSLKERPILNSIYPTTRQLPEPRSFDLDTLIYWVKRTPECIGIIKRIATDIVTEISFVSVTSQKTGRPSPKFNEKVEDKARAFAGENFLKQKLTTGIMDWLMTGDVYFWKGKLSDEQIKETAKEHYKSYGVELKEIEIKQFFDEDYNGINSFDVIPSSMVRIHHDEYKIKNYVQLSKVAPGDNVVFTTDEVIHGKLLNMDGKVYGYSPMEASYLAIRTINSIQDYGYFYFENGAKVDRVWKFMGNPNKTSIEKFREQLQEYKSIRRSHSDLILEGADKIEQETLNEITAEMEYRQLAIHSVGRLAFAFNMPADILSSILGKDVRGTAIGSDVEDAGYNRNILQSQQYFEDLLNSQLFLPEFKVEMKFERTFRQDQIRQAQYMIQVLPILDYFFQHEIPVEDEYFIDMLQIPRKYLKEGKIKKEIEIAMPFDMGAKKPPPGPNQAGFQEAKRKQQKPQQTNNPPSGV